MEFLCLCPPHEKTMSKNDHRLPPRGSYPSVSKAKQELRSALLILGRSMITTTVESSLLQNSGTFREIPSGQEKGRG